MLYSERFELASERGQFGALPYKEPVTPPTRNSP
jgi:hypothetical protein